MYTKGIECQVWATHTNQSVTCHKKHLRRLASLMIITMNYTYILYGFFKVTLQRHLILGVAEQKTTFISIFNYIFPFFDLCPLCMPHPVPHNFGPLFFFLNFHCFTYTHICLMYQYNLFNPFFATYMYMISLYRRIFINHMNTLDVKGLQL